MAIDISQISIFNKITFVLHTGEGKAGINHMKYWISEFLKANREFAIITRNEEVYKSLSKEYSQITIIYATTPLEIEEVVNKLVHLKTIFYTSNTGNNIHLLRFIDYKHIYIGTEYSDRDGKITKFIRAYDEAWISSDSIVEKITSEIDPGHLKLVKIGKPQLYDILANTRSRKDNGILYLTSNEGNSEEKNFSSLDILPSVLTTLGDQGFDFDMILDKKIGYRDKYLKNFAKDIQESAYMQGIQCILRNEYDTDLLTKNRYLICDLATLNYKVLASKSIILLYIPKDKDANYYMLEKYIEYKFLYTFSNMIELKKIMNDISNGNDIMQKSRESGIEYWIGEKATLNQSFLEKMKNLNSENN